MNDVPVGTQAAIEDVPRAFAISVNDVDVGNAPLLISLSSTNGTLITLPAAAGLSFSSGDGTADASLSFSGTLTDINAALNGLTITPVVDIHADVATTFESKSVVINVNANDTFSNAGHVVSAIDGHASSGRTRAHEQTAVGNRGRCALRRSPFCVRGFRFDLRHHSAGCGRSGWWSCAWRP